jgi:hypothetical protein
MGAHFGTQRRLTYRYLKPVNRGGRRCLSLHPRIAHERPDLLASVLDFAAANRLVELPGD